MLVLAVTLVGASVQPAFAQDKEKCKKECPQKCKDKGECKKADKNCCKGHSKA